VADNDSANSQRLFLAKKANSGRHAAIKARKARSVRINTHARSTTVLDVYLRFAFT
jgi:hypothetical protein